MTTSAAFVSPRAYHDAISDRAHEIWRARGCPEGSDVEIWLEAERDLASRGLIPAAPPRSRSDRPRTDDSDDIDQVALSDRLGDFGESRSRGPTSIDVTHPAGTEPLRD